MTSQFASSRENHRHPWERQRQVKKVTRYVLTYAIMILFAFIFLFPLLFMIMASFKANDAIFADLRSFRAFMPVGNLSMDNYHGVFERSKFGFFLQNSLFISGMTTLLALVVNSMAAYVLARLKWRGQSVVLAVIIATLIVPFETIVVPLLLIVSKLPWPVLPWLEGFVGNRAGSIRIMSRSSLGSAARS